MSARRRAIRAAFRRQVGRDCDSVPVGSLYVPDAAGAYAAIQKAMPKGETPVASLPQYQADRKPKWVQRADDGPDGFSWHRKYKLLFPKSRMRPV